MKNDQAIQEYAIQVNPLLEADGGGFEALFPQLSRSIVGYGETQQEAIEDLLSGVPAFLQIMEQTEQILPAPETPKTWDDFSGKFNVRVPKMLHAKLVRLADEQGVSLNSLVQTILMSGATALEAGHEFGAVVELEAEPAIPKPYNWQTDSRTGAPSLKVVGGNLPRERNPDHWRTATGELYA